MKPFLLIAAIALSTGLLVQAQQDTAYHRKVYADVNDRLGDFSTNKVLIKRAGETGKTAVQVWWEASLVRKVVLKEKQGPDYTRTTEFYYNPEQVLTFVFQSDNDGRTTAENRFYFNKAGDHLVKWLGADKKPVPPGSHDFTDMGAELIRASNEILQQVGD